MRAIESTRHPGDAGASGGRDECRDVPSGLAVHARANVSTQQTDDVGPGVHEGKSGRTSGECCTEAVGAQASQISATRSRRQARGGEGSHGSPAGAV